MFAFIAKKGFSQEASLTRHNYQQTGEKPLKCGQCDWSCIQKISMQKHMRIHVTKTSQTNDAITTQERKPKG